MILVRIFYLVAIIASIGWFFSTPGFDSGIAVLTSFSALLADVFRSRAKKKQTGQRQTVSSGGIGIQGGGDVTVGSVSLDGRNKDA